MKCWKKPLCDYDECIDNCPMREQAMPIEVKACIGCTNWLNICKSLGKKANECCGRFERAEGDKHD